MADKDGPDRKKPGPEAEPIVVPLPFEEAVQAALATKAPDMKKQRKPDKRRK